MAGKSGRTIDATPRDTLKKSILSWEGILAVILVAVIIFCKIISPNYTFENVLREMPKYLSEIFLMFPMALILMMGEIDISVGSTVCLASTVGCMVSNAGASFGVALLIMAGTGVVCGVINGLIITQFPELPSMIVTLGTQIIYRGIAEVLLGDGGSIALEDFQSFKILRAKIGPVPYLFILALVVGAIFVIVTTKTKSGRHIYAIGSNRKTAFYSGVKVKKILFTAYTLMGLFAGISAMFLTSVLNGVNTTTGKNFEMDAIAMAVFGGIATTGGKGNMIGGIISAFVIICLRIGLGQINLNGQVILIIIGILLILSVLLPNVSSKLKMKRKK